MQDDERPRLRLEAAEAAVELVAVGHRRHGIVGSRNVDRYELDIQSVTPEPARLIDARADKQSVEPRFEAVVAAKRGEVSPGPNERLLDGVLGLIRIPQDQSSGCVQPADRGGRERGEGVMIASSSTGHEFLQDLTPIGRRGRSGRARQVWRGEIARRSDSAGRYA